MVRETKVLLEKKKKKVKQILRFSVFCVQPAPPYPQILQTTVRYNISLVVAF